MSRACCEQVQKAARVLCKDRTAHRMVRKEEALGTLLFFWLLSYAKSDCIQCFPFQAVLAAILASSFPEEFS